MMRHLDAFVLTLALVRIGYALVRVGAGDVPGTVFTSVPVLAAHLAVRSGAGFVLYGFGRHDPRARALGVVFVLSASAFADVALGAATGWLATVLRRIQPVAFLPFYVWTFLHRFPVRTAFGRARRVDRTFRGLALAIGALWFLLELGRLPAGDLGWAPGFDAAVSGLGRGAEGSLFWITFWIVLLPGVPYALWKLRMGGAADRRRARVVLAAIVVGILPSVLLLGAWSASSAVRSALSRPDLIPVWTGVVHASQLSVPVTVSWAVLTRRALSVRLVVRQAAWYVLARRTAVLLLALPAGGLGILLVANRSQGVAAVLDGTWGLPLVVAFVLGGAALSWRRELFDAIDRRFFREQYEARSILGALVERIAERSGLGEILDAVRSEIERALHPRSVEVFVPTEQGELAPAGGGFATLTLPTDVTDRLMTRGDAVRVEEPRWTREGDRAVLVPFALLVPLRDRSGTLVAALALGEKRSELPYTVEDLELLERVGDVLGRHFGRIRREDAADPGAGQSEPNAMECVSCHAVLNEPRCPECGIDTGPAPVPSLLVGKIRIVARVGQGGMGVVYRGVDRTLGRPVAVKALPPTLMPASGRALREARTMASVVHPNVAVIYGVESWRGAPVLVVEYLAAGTLRDRLEAAGPLPWREAVTLIVALAGGVHALHAAGILHRDIKPSNVGFTADGVPKLLDFGLARAETEGVDWAAGQDNADVGAAATATRTGALVGTLPYLAPEVVAGHRPEPAVDVWALSVLLFESLSGVSPFLERTPALTALRLRKAEPPDAGLLPTDVPESVRTFLEDALTPDGRARPRTAGQFLQGVGRLV